MTISVPLTVRKDYKLDDLLTVAAEMLALYFDVRERSAQTKLDTKTLQVNISVQDEVTNKE